MAFDQRTRNLLQRTVTACRRVLDREFTAQLQELYGIQPDGAITPSAALEHLGDDEQEVARLLRERINHLEGGAAAEALTRTAAKPDHVARVIREQAFTVLNRLAALRLCEERGLVLECVRRGVDSEGYALFASSAGNALGETHEAYRAYLHCLFDELALELGVLFDRFSPLALLFPRHDALVEVLKELNGSGRAAEREGLPAEQFAQIWQADETIGWIYQYYNDEAERKNMREESSAPRNSRELAVRNQFFTPRYVVEFLTDNTLGRLWFEMTRGETRRKEQCRYLVRRPNEIFLKPGEALLEQPPQVDLSQEELLKQPVHMPHRPLKDPRTILMLDPACGSMHFGLYAFDLFEVIYGEAWELEGALGADALARPPGLKPLHATYAGKDAFLKDVPRLIIEHNLHGIDIDPRCVQIAGLSLWLRAQRAWQQVGLKPSERPAIKRSNVVCAEPMPGEKELLREFVEREFQAEERGVFLRLLEVIFDKMQLAGEAGSLLKIEEEIHGALEEAREGWAKLQSAPGNLFSTAELNAMGTQQEIDATTALRPLAADFWATTEGRLLAALREYAERAEVGGGFQRRLFAEDAARGFAFIDVCRKHYDVVVMNPPFGLPTPMVEALAKESFERTWQDIYGCFFERALAITWPSAGYVGAITPKSYYHAKGFRGLRDLIQEYATLNYSVDIGGGVLDAAVEVCLSILESRKALTKGKAALFFNLVSAERAQLAEHIAHCVDLVCSGSSSDRIVSVIVDDTVGLPNAMLPYRFPADLLHLIRTLPSFESGYGNSVVGITTFDNDRFIRARWETNAAAIQGHEWIPVAMGGGWDPFFGEFNLVARWRHEAAEMRANELRRYDTTARTMQSQGFWFRPGLTFSKISKGFSVQPFPTEAVFTSVGFCIFSDKHDLWTWLGYFNSKPICCLMSLFSADRHWHSNSVAYLPVPANLGPTVAELAKEAFEICAAFGRTSETAPEFVQCELLRRLEDLSRDYVNITAALAREVSEAFALLPATLEWMSQNTIYAEREFVIGDVERWKRRLSYALGCAFGRWDIRYATGEHAAPELPDPFAPLPVCPPGQLQIAQGLPAGPEDVPAEYPVQISWDGIFVDDPNHSLDIERRARDVIGIIWKERAEGIEREACEMLGVMYLGDYFRKPGGFFADHLKRYSKSRRQAPIYWPLSTPSGSYTLWIYYHRLTPDTLYKCIQQFVFPKLADVEKELAHIRNVLGAGEGGAKERKRFEEVEGLRRELIELRTELELWAPKWKPNLNDGVLITAAPLWKLFRLPKWQKDLKACWQELERGDYDWAHLAHTLWPERVREKCRSDRSLAIAHGLEELCEVAEPVKKQKRAKKKVGPAPELEI